MRARQQRGARGHTSSAGAATRAGGQIRGYLQRFATLLFWSVAPAFKAGTCLQCARIYSVGLKAGATKTRCLTYCLNVDAPPPIVQRGTARHPRELAPDARADRSIRPSRMRARARLRAHAQESVARSCPARRMDGAPSLFYSAFPKPRQVRPASPFRLCMRHSRRRVAPVQKAVLAMLPWLFLHPPSDWRAA